MVGIEALSCLVGPVIGLVKLVFKKSKCPQIVAVCVPRFSGKSTFINSVSSNDYLLLDLEANVKLVMTDEEKTQLQSLQGNPSYDLHYKPIAKKYLDKIREEHKGKSIIVFVSSLELCKYCGIKKVHTFIPSQSLTEQIKGQANGENQRAFEACRNQLLCQLKPKQLNTYDTFLNLAQQLKDKFNLVSKL